jgi:altronate dehydratase small subunit
MINAMKIKERDNVAVAIEPIAQGETVRYALPDGGVCELAAAENIQIYHKLSTEPIGKGSAVLKYGESIGIATMDVAAGCHVHVHNVTSEQELKREGGLS